MLCADPPRPTRLSGAPAARLVASERRLKLPSRRSRRPFRAADDNHLTLTNL